MRTLTRRLAPHARTAWLVLVAVVLLAVAIAVTAVLAAGGGRPGVVASVFTGVVVFGVLAAVLDAILVPGNPDMTRRRGHDAGWTGMGAASWTDAGSGGSGGDAGGHCG